MFGKCKTCIEKDARIADLKEQVAYFKSVLHPEPKPRLFQIEEDTNETKLLDGGGTEEVNLEAEYIKAELLRREEDAIFSGNTEFEEVGS